MKYRKFMNSEVKNTFQNYPKKMKDKLLLIRESVFSIAEQHDVIGEVEETLKWQNPSYLTHKPKSGTTLRLQTMRADNDKYGLFVHCQTTLIAEFKVSYPDLNYDGNRGIVFDIKDSLPKSIIEHFIFLALTYHQRK